MLASLATAREIAGDPGQGSTYFVARVRPGASAKAVQQRLNQSTPSFGPYEAWTAKEFARRSQRYWMLDTGAGAGVLGGAQRAGHGFGGLPQTGDLGRGENLDLDRAAGAFGNQIRKAL